MSITIRPRSAWGARYADGAGPAPLPAGAGLFLHHSTTQAANGPAAVAELERIGQQRFGAGISYTWACSPDGTLWQGHSITRLGSHTKGYNTTGRAVVLIGNGVITDAQIETVAQLLAYGVEAGWWPTTQLRPHHAVRATECPGAAPTAAIPTIVARARQILDHPTTTPETFMALTDAEQTELLVKTRAIHAVLVGPTAALTILRKRVDELWREVITARSGGRGYLKRRLDSIDSQLKKGRG